MNDRERLAAIYVQGVIAGRLLDVPGFRLDQRRDDAGLYVPWFDVVLDDGTRVRVRCEVAP